MYRYLLPQITIGVLQKNENIISEMTDILKDLQKLVPGNDPSEPSDVHPMPVFSGGDYLTHERSHGSQLTVANNRTPCRRLEGLISKVEEFHNQMELLGVIAFK